MSKKSLFGWGLFLGSTAAAAYAVFEHLNNEQKKQVINKVNRGVDSLKNRAIDYAFYASDAVDDAKQSLGNKFNDAKDSLGDASDKLNDRIKKNAVDDNDEDQSSQFRTAADRLKDELHDASEDSEDDIVVNADDVLNRNQRVETFYPDHSKKTQK